ncbi:MAG: ABC-F family ATP-binding cassette domain-containing protein [Acetatifactor sp.]|nr:ABC-F family ATP-binding cassette domain-containing protein [Acetatifactor sp.]
MNILNIENLTKSYTDRLLFKEASFFVQEGEKVGIVGVNGTGKSTLLKIIAGKSNADGGTITMANNTVISYLPQNPEFDDLSSIEENILKITGNLTETLTLLTKLGIDDISQKCGELSGGQKKKLSLAITLSKESDLILLDEPTNHLDYGYIEWLQKFLNASKKTLIMVTHDRYFLDEVCDRIVEIDDSHIYSYDTNYSGFLERKTAREESLKSFEQKRQNILRREVEWIRRGARARSTKQKAHIQRYEALRDAEAPKIKEELSFSSASTRMGKSTVELKNISFSYGEKTLIKDFSYNFLKGDRVGFIGENGCGKTTLMKLISGDIKPDEGDINIGQTIKLGIYTQEVLQANPSERVIDFVKDIGEYIPTVDGVISATQLLERFLFDADKQYSPIGKLSGGEKRRLALLSILMSAPNVLILDEPTNDLDTETLAVLEDYLESFDGIVITVSHDRHFLDRIVNRIFAFEGDGKITQYEGGYTDYLDKAPVKFWEMDKKGDQGKNAGLNNPDQPGTDSRSTWKVREKKIKFTFAEQKEYETIESDIQKLEETIKKADEDMVKNAKDFVKLAELSAKKEEAENLLLEKMDRWEYLEEKAALIGEQG